MGVNSVFVAGPIDKTKVRFYDGKKFGYLNLVLGDNIPAVVKYGGARYDASVAQALCDRIQAADAPHALIADGYIQQRSPKAREGGWEIVTSPYAGKFEYYPYEAAVNFVYLHGKILELAPDGTGAPWIELGMEYWSQPPGGVGETKTRSARVKLPAGWDQNVVNHGASLWGHLEAKHEGQALLHVVADAIKVL